MEITTFNLLLKRKYPSGDAYVVYKSDKRSANVNIEFATGQKVYTYRSTTIQALAEKLELVPSINYNDEADRLLKLFRENPNGIYRGFCGTFDTLNHNLVKNKIIKSGYTLKTSDKGFQKYYFNEYNQKLTDYFVGVNEWA